jgi:hypothetical protein
LGVPKISDFYGVYSNGRRKRLKRLPFPTQFWDWSMTGSVFGGEKKYSRCQETRHQNSCWRGHGGVVYKRPNNLRYGAARFALHTFRIPVSVVAAGTMLR